LREASSGCPSSQTRHPPRLWLACPQSFRLCAPGHCSGASTFREVLTLRRGITFVLSGRCRRRASTITSRCRRPRSAGFFTRLPEDRPASPRCFRRRGRSMRRPVHPGWLASGFRLRCIFSTWPVPGRPRPVRRPRSTQDRARAPVSGRGRSTRRIRRCTVSGTRRRCTQMPLQLPYTSGPSTQCRPCPSSIGRLTTRLSTGSCATSPGPFATGSLFAGLLQNRASPRLLAWARPCLARRFDSLIPLRYAPWRDVVG
jgi:hypothetical protein